MTVIRPDPSTPLRALPLPPPSKRVSNTLSRMSAFLEGVMLPSTKVRAMLSGYTPDAHSMGVYLAEHLAGQRPFSEWRINYSLRPPRDPDLPELVAELDAFREKWLPVVTRAAATISDPLERLELQDVLRDPVNKRSRVWRAKAWVRIATHLKNIDLDFYQVAWTELERAGFADELPRFNQALEIVEAYIRDAPLEDIELEDIANAREATGRCGLVWLEERRKQLEGHLHEDTLAVLGLGERFVSASPPFHIARALSWRVEQN